MDFVLDGTPKLTLYSWWMSSCTFRVRIALNLKGLEYEYKAVDLLKDEHSTPEFLKLNPTGFVPVLVDGDVVVGDSFAIILYLEEKYPRTPLLPRDLQKIAINYQVATIVSSGIQPFQNLDMLKYIEENVSPNEKFPWATYHIKKGFAALEVVLNGHIGKYATGDEVSLICTYYNLLIYMSCFINSRGHNKNVDYVVQTDIFLAPQIDGAITRFNMNMDEFPLLKRLNEAYSEVPAFVDAMPINQPDAPTSRK